MFETLLDAFAAATGCDRAALGVLVGEVPDPATLPAEPLLERIAATEKAVQAMQAVQVHNLAAFARVQAAEDLEDGAPDSLAGRAAAVEVGFTVGVATMTAQHRLAEATCAVQDHPMLLARLGTGAVSMAGLGRVIAATWVLEPGLRLQVDAQLAAELDRTTLTPGRLAAAAERRVLAADPAAADKRAAAARSRRRCVRLGDPVDGVAGIYATLRAEEALAVFARLDSTARGMRRGGDDRSIDTLMADLFVESVLGAAMTAPSGPSGLSGLSGLSGPSGPAGPVPVWRSVDGYEPWLWSAPPPLPPHDDPGSDDEAWDQLCTGPPPADPTGTATHPAHAPPLLPAAEPAQRRLPINAEVQVVISAATLLGLDDQPATLRGYGAVPGWVVHDLVDTAAATGARTTLRGLFCDPVDGRLVAMDSAARLFTGGLRQFALWRDQGCRVSGGRIVDVDHVVERRRGGPTAALNGQSLGKLAHVLKDHPGVRVTARPPVRVGDGLDHLRAHAPDVEWRLPAGHIHRTAPPPALGAGSDPEPDQPDSGWEQRLTATAG